MSCPRPNPPGVPTDDSFFNELNKHRGKRCQRLCGGDDSYLPSQEHLIDLGRSAQDIMMAKFFTPDTSVVHDFTRGPLSSPEKSGILNEMHGINLQQCFISATHLMLDDESEPSYSSSQSETSLQSINQEYLANESPPFLASPATSSEEIMRIYALYPAQVALSPGQSHLSNESPPFFESPSTSPEREHKSAEYSAEQLYISAFKAQNGADNCNVGNNQYMGQQQQLAPGRFPDAQSFPPTHRQQPNVCPQTPTRPTNHQPRNPFLQRKLMLAAQANSRQCNRLAPTNRMQQNFPSTPVRQLQIPTINVSPPSPQSPQNSCSFPTTPVQQRQIPTISVCPATPPSPQTPQNNCEYGRELDSTFTMAGPGQSLNSTYNSDSFGLNTTYPMTSPTQSWGANQWGDVTEQGKCPNQPRQQQIPTINVIPPTPPPQNSCRRQWERPQQPQMQRGVPPAAWAPPPRQQQIPTINVCPPTPPPQNSCPPRQQQIPTINVCPATPPPQNSCNTPPRQQQIPTINVIPPTPPPQNSCRRQWERPPQPQQQGGVAPAAWASCPQGQPSQPCMAQAQPAMQANKLTMQGECKSSMKQKVLYDSLVRDQYAPGIIQCTLDGNADFNKTSFDLLFGVDVPKCQPEVEPLSLLEAFYLRINFEREQMFGCYLDTVDIETHFSKQLPTELNNAIASLFKAEQLEDEKNPKKIDFDADIKSTTVTLQGSNMSACIPIILSNFTGSTKAKSAGSSQSEASPAAETPAAEETPAEPPAEEAAPAAEEAAPAAGEAEAAAAEEEKTAE